MRKMLICVSAALLLLAGCRGEPDVPPRRAPAPSPVAVQESMGLAPATVVPTACPDIVPAQQPAGTPLTIVAVGDSITHACRWQVEYSRLLATAGVPHRIVTYAVSATDCTYWTGRIGQVLSQTQPDVAVLYCGTGDKPDEQCYGEPCTAWAYRFLVEAIHGSRPAAPPLIVHTVIGVSDPMLAPMDMWNDSEPRTIDIMWSQMLRYPTDWYAGVVPVDRMPATATYLDGEGCDPSVSVCGIHPNEHGYVTIGRLMYDGTQARMGWPLATALGEPVLCGMSGHRRGYPRPSYVPCP
ncbi:MAG: SGNH/GDSL hydrolase family protein [Gemmatimonadota bacterium]|nr:SGNH/GDSL hydrolase family protein [Gemmatimonadota bacterium]